MVSAGFYNFMKKIKFMVRKVLPPPLLSYKAIFEKRGLAGADRNRRRLFGDYYTKGRVDVRLLEAVPKSSLHSKHIFNVTAVILHCIVIGQAALRITNKGVYDAFHTLPQPL